ncbi:thioredoxin [bacterium]
MASNLPKSFDSLITESKLPVLVDFWAEWCGACKMVTPVIERIARDLKGQIITIKVNVDKKQHLAQRYQITGIPAIMLFHQGQILMRLSGAVPYETLRTEVEKHLK